LGTPEVRAVLWRDGKIIDLGALGGNESQAADINNRSQIVGAWANTIPDEFSPYGFGTQTRAFLWENGVMRDLGTLGGPDAIPVQINERGQVAGASFTDWTANPSTGIPTLHPFLWEGGRMLDLGTLGGSIAGAVALNNRGQVAGLSNLAADLTAHPFFWDGRSLRDLGTFGGDNGEADSLNDAGEVVGVADFPGGVFHDAFLWINGVLMDLGNLGETSHAYSINSGGQIVGGSRVSFVTGEIRAFLWENGGPMVDLNTLISATSDLRLAFAYSINDRGEIAGLGVFPNGDQHAFLLIPIGEP